MNQDEWTKKLEADGYSNIQTQTFPANFKLPEHTHQQATAHVILAGQVTVSEASNTTSLAAGDRFDVPAGTTHEAQCGPDGCTFLVGVKE